MPKCLLILLLFLGLTLAASPLRAAEPGPYLELEGFGSWLSGSKNLTNAGSFNAEYDGASTGGGVALGYDFAEAYPNIGRGRLELEAASRKNAVKKLAFAEGKLPANGDVTVKSLMVNTIGEYYNGTRWLPYLALGAGYAKVSITQVSTAGTAFIASSSDGVFAYQFGTGLGVELGDHLILDLGYRYFATLRPNLKLTDGSTFKGEVASHNLLLGLRFKY